MEFFGPHHIDVLSGIFGSLLGDSYAEKRAGKCRIVLQQENSNQEYLFGVHYFLSSRGYCNIEKPKQEKRIGKNNKIRFFLRVRTYSFASFCWLHESFYQDKLKCIPSRELLLKYLTPIALTVWICDEGTATGDGGISIATNSFSKEDILMLCEVLYEKYGIIAKPNKIGFSKKDRKQQYCLYIWKRSVPILITVTSPFIVPSMLRKLHVKA